MDGKDERTMISLSFTAQNHPEWDQKMQTGLRNLCKHLTGLTETFKPHTIYAQSNDTFVGGITVEQHGIILWIDTLWIEPDFRNKGIGQELINQAFLYAIQQGVQELQLNTYFPEAYTFFLSQGFEDVAVIPNWKYGLTCYLMRKQL